MRIQKAFEISDIATARSIIRSHPFATLVTADLRATHMPCLVDEDAAGLTILGHVARADPLADSLEQPMLAIFNGPHGYISASWYDGETIPTWNHLTVHVRGRAELFDDPMPLLRRTVDHFEAAVHQSWSLDRMGLAAREMADQVIGFRLHAESWHAEAKLSQDKPRHEQARVLAALESDAAYANHQLAAAMRDVARQSSDA
jgi:transcriptional regulator